MQDQLRRGVAADQTVYRGKCFNLIQAPANLRS